MTPCGAMMHLCGSYHVFSASIVIFSSDHGVCVGNGFVLKCILFCCKLIHSVISQCTLILEPFSRFLALSSVASCMLSDHGTTFDFVAV